MSIKGSIGSFNAHFYKTREFVMAKAKIIPFDVHHFQLSTLN